MDEERFKIVYFIYVPCSFDNWILVIETKIDEMLDRPNWT